MALRNFTTDAPVLVYGATGHTGRFIVAELLRRGRTPVLCGRDVVRLAEMAREFPGLTCHVASIDDADALDKACRGAAAVINAAGPFLDTAQPLLDAALRNGAHYFDTSAEQGAAVHVFEQDARAKAAGIVAIPSVAFYGAFADLLATAAMGDWERADAIDIAVGLDGWHPTRGTRITGERNRAVRWIVEGGELRPLPDPVPTREWEFPAPLGPQDTVMLTLSEIVSIARHLRSSKVHSYMNLAPLRDLRDPSTPQPVAADDRGRSSQQFVLDVRVQRDGLTRRAVAQGRDIYAVTAPLIVEALDRVLAGEVRHPGAWAAGEVFDAAQFLRTLAQEHFDLTLDGVESPTIEEAAEAPWSGRHKRMQRERR
ncbi:saccharopine dehydrogenase family protein [Lysobacter auxotrophicus]|uniref:Saccharopine dehydrogenase NADP-binding domain-containing protein n=1 Tax=Lysobacter auxotrophicus TaxID=2992573 RepID=A0ABM8DIM6_9GAMM|nr:saccharopine dehydrogenase NADP-binding domain-containing protein [Lysobacter auxotrophicus]BDU18507.1 saccharopine dehydrogenase NADP-binding domain-containing protein [Lysobacter auxotrophicus]